MARPNYFFPAHDGQRQNQQSGVGRFLDVTSGPLLNNTSLGVPTGVLGSFLVEGAKGSFPNVNIASNDQMKQLVNDLRE